MKCAINSDLMDGVADDAYEYFNHSYYCDPYDPKDVVAQATYGIPFAAAVQNGSLYGVQFHPV